MARVGNRIHLFNGRSKHIVGPHLLQQLAVGLQRARISVQVSLIVKLRWVKENTYNGNAVFLYTSLHKRSVSFM